MPLEVPLAKPPSPSASSHSRLLQFEVGFMVGVAAWGLAAGLESRIQRHATIDEDAGAVDVVAFVARQPDAGAADVVRLTDAFVGDELHQLAVGFGRAPSFHVNGCADGAGTDRVDADAVRGHFL